MKNFKNITLKEVTKLTCDSCGEQATPSDYTFHEFISINKRCGYGSIHGDGKQLTIDLCQQCFADICGDSLTIADPNNEKDDEILEYHNIFEAITQSKKEALSLQNDSNLLIEIRDILSANIISNQKELSFALKRVEQLWDVQYQDVEANEFNQLCKLICNYEGKTWDSHSKEEGSNTDEDIELIKKVLQRKNQQEI